MRALFRGLVDLVLSPRCGACGSWQAAPLCDVCRASLEPDTETSRIPHLADCVAAVAYEGDVADWMQRFKYPGTGLRKLDRAPLGVFAFLLEEAAWGVPGRRPDWVVPVPLHPRRLRERGFNLSLIHI